jgi:hypothetical protein
MRIAPTAKAALMVVAKAAAAAVVAPTMRIAPVVVCALVVSVWMLAVVAAAFPVSVLPTGIVRRINNACKTPAYRVATSPPSTSYAVFRFRRRALFAGPPVK